MLHAKVAGAGFEPTINGLWGHRSTRLNYPAAFHFFKFLIGVSVITTGLPDAVAEQQIKNQNQQDYPANAQAARRPVGLVSPKPAAE